MKPEPAVYDVIPVIPKKGFRQAQPKGAYCSGCGNAFALDKKQPVDGVDENGKAYYLKCLFCGCST